MAGRPQPQPDRPDRDGGDRCREDGERREEHVERVEVSELPAPVQGADDQKRDGAEVQPVLDGRFPTHEEPGDHDRGDRAGAQRDERDGSLPRRVERRHARGGPAAHHPVAGDESPGDGRDEGDAGRDERPAPDGRDLGQPSRREQGLADAHGPHGPDPDQRQRGDRDVCRQDHRGGAADERRQRPRSPDDCPSTARPYIDEQDRHRGEAVRGDPEDQADRPRAEVRAGDQRHRREEQAGEEPEEERRRATVEPVSRRTSVPVSAAAASNSSGRTTKWRASSGAVPKIVMTAASSHISPQWYQVWAGRPSMSGKPDGE